jgi:hypothetical protein
LLGCILAPLAAGCGSSRATSATADTWKTLYAGTRPVDCVHVLVPADYPRGLSGKPAAHGAVFTFYPPRIQAFWMKDTVAPIAIYWLDGDTVLGHDLMAPRTLTSHDPPAPITSAIELPASKAPSWAFTTMTLGTLCAAP